MILFVDQSGQLGGAELCLADLAAHFGADAHTLLFSDGPLASILRQQGLSVEILPLPVGAGRAEKKSSPVQLLATIPGLLRHTTALAANFRSARVLYFNTAKAIILGTFANVFARRPAIVHIHDLWDASHFPPLSRRLLVAAANRADAVIANSAASARAFLDGGGKHHPHIIPNGFDPARFAGTPSGQIFSLRKEWNPTGGSVAAVFGRLSRWKGQHLLIEAARALPELTVWIVGDALFTQDDRAYAAELRDLAASMGPRVQFLDFRDDVPDLMAAADIIVHTSTSPEPFGRVIVEGMLSAKPVIAANAGGPREIIDDNITGLLFDPGNTASLTQALRRLIDSPDLAIDMGARGRAVAQSRYGIDAVCEQTANLITAVAKT